jgi:hypothetical protein
MNSHDISETRYVPVLSSNGGWEGHTEMDELVFQRFRIDFSNIPIEYL